MIQIYDTDMVLIALLAIFLSYFFETLTRIAWLLFRKSLKYGVCAFAAATGVFAVAAFSPNSRYVAKQLSRVFGSGVDIIERVKRAAY